MPDADAILTRHGVDTDDAVSVLRELVATPSATGREEALARLLVDRGRHAGMIGRLQEIAPGRIRTPARPASTSASRTTSGRSRCISR